MHVTTYKFCIGIIYMLILLNTQNNTALMASVSIHNIIWDNFVTASNPV